MCAVPDSYVIRLDDGRYFRRTRSAINIDNSSSAGFGLPRQQFLPVGGLPAPVSFPMSVSGPPILSPVRAPNSDSATRQPPAGMSSVTVRRVREIVQPVRASARLMARRALPDEALPDIPVLEVSMDSAAE